MNMVCLLGRLTADPELRHTQNQVSVANFTLAVDRSYTPKGQEKQTDFINIVTWRHTAEFVCNYCRKGQRIALIGELQSRRYVDKDGNNRTAYEVVASNVFFADSKSSSTPTVPAPNVPGQTEGADIGAFEEVPEVDDDDLPF